MHSRDAPPSHVAMEAIIAAIFEILYLAARAPGEPQVAGMLPYIAHVWLSPFLGCEGSDAFIDSQTPKKVKSRRTGARRAKATPRE
jgi:hypothetical protein